MFAKVKSNSIFNQVNQGCVFSFSIAAELCSNRYFYLPSHSSNWFCWLTVQLSDFAGEQNKVVLWASVVELGGFLSARHHLVTPPSAVSTTQVHSAHKHTGRHTLARLLASLRELVSHGDPSAFPKMRALQCAQRFLNALADRREAELKLNCRMASKLWIITALRTAAGWSDSSLFIRTRKKAAH